MGWFDEQIKQRKLNDNQVFEDSFKQIGDAIFGRRFADELNETYYTKSAMEQILKYYNHKPVAIPDDIKEFNEQIEYSCRQTGIMRRRIKLTSGFYKDAYGPILAFDKETNNAVALIPRAFNGYSFVIDGKVEKINNHNEQRFLDDGYCFYKPLPLRKLSTLDLVKYALSSISFKETLLTLVLLTITTFIGLLIPKISFFLMNDVIEQKSVNLLITTLIFMFTINVSNLMFTTIKSSWSRRVNTKMNNNVQAATMMRVLSLPANFFRKYASGDLTSRVSYVSSLASILMDTIFTTSLTSLFSLTYISSIFGFAKILVVPSLLIILSTVICSLVSTLIMSKRSLARMKYASKESGMSYAMLSGIQKIKLAGAEKRAFSRWGNIYAKQARETYRPEYISLVSSIISYVGMIVLYFISVKANLSPAGYYSFNTAYGMVSGAFSSFVSIALTFANIKPTLEMAKPILDAEPEVGENKKIVTRIQGGIEINGVSFRYDDNTPLVIDDLSLKIKPGEYIAIVGKTGCGKSTLIRLLLGFEKPQKGAIYYDGQDINSLELKSLRRKIGTVMQDGKLFMGDVFSNITISAPWLTLDDAWAAADMAGIGDDIRRMPMGMNTLISEGSGGISGGQRQRLLIARAIAPKPRVLIFDEATSALDNITQRKVAESLDSLKCTRIVIAHRLSTIKHCDKILYLENGKILEEGTYDELIKLDGKFAKLVQRQRLSD